MKISIIYYSRTGTTEQMAEMIKDGINEQGKAEAKTFPIQSIDSDWLKESSAIIAGTPIYMASVAGEMKTFLETEIKKYGVSGKLGGAFATADYVHGGGELGIQTILDHMLTLGMLTYSGGGAFGKPVIHLGPVAIKGNENEYAETFKTYGKRIAEMTEKLFSK